jgi:hypothetical protein
LLAEKRSKCFSSSIVLQNGNARSLTIYILIFFSRTTVPCAKRECVPLPISVVSGDLTLHPRWLPLLRIGWKIWYLWKYCSSESLDGMKANLVQIPVLLWYPFKIMFVDTVNYSRWPPPLIMQFLLFFPSIITSDIINKYPHLCDCVVKKGHQGFSAFVDRICKMTWKKADLHEDTSAY